MLQQKGKSNPPLGKSHSKSDLKERLMAKRKQGDSVSEVEEVPNCVSEEVPICVSEAQALDNFTDCSQTGSSSDTPSASGSISSSGPGQPHDFSVPKPKRQKKISKKQLAASKSSATKSASTSDSLNESAIEPTTGECTLTPAAVGVSQTDTEEDEVVFIEKTDCVTEITQNSTEEIVISTTTAKSTSKSASVKREKREKGKMTPAQAYLADIEKVTGSTVNLTASVSTDAEALLDDLAHLPPELQKKIEIRNEKVKELVRDLESLEACCDCNDTASNPLLQLEEARNKLIFLIRYPTRYVSYSVPPVVSPISDASPEAEACSENKVDEPQPLKQSVDQKPTENTETSQTSDEHDKNQDDLSHITSSCSQPFKTLSEQLNEAIRVLTARSVQGSTKPLSGLVVAVSQILLGCLAAATATSTMEETSSEEVVDWSRVVDEADQELKRNEAIEYVKRESESVALAERIKDLANRESFGLNLGKNNFETVDALGVMRWEVGAEVSAFSKEAITVLAHVKTMRKKYNSAIKAAVRVRDQLKKTPEDEVKIASLETAEANARDELKKWKQRRNEAAQKHEQKRQVDAEAKMKRDEALLAKRKEKDEREVIYIPSILLKISYSIFIYSQKRVIFIIRPRRKLCLKPQLKKNWQKKN